MNCTRIAHVGSILAAIDVVFIDQNFSGFVALALMFLTPASVFVVCTCLAWHAGFGETFFGECAALFNHCACKCHE